MTAGAGGDAAGPGSNRVCARDFASSPRATSDILPYFEPCKDFVGIFLLDRPDSDHPRQWRGYITTR
jgi:hypothetical protein